MGHFKMDRTCSSVLGNVISLIISSFSFPPLCYSGASLFEMFSLMDWFSNIPIFPLLLFNSLLFYTRLWKVSSSLASKLSIYCPVLIYGCNILSSLGKELFCFVLVLVPFCYLHYLSLFFKAFFFNCIDSYLPIRAFTQIPGIIQNLHLTVRC